MRTAGITNQFSTTPLGRKPFPMAFGDNFDCSVNHFDGGLIVDQYDGTGMPAAHFSALAMELSGISG